MDLLGLKVIPSQFAREVRTEFHVVRASTLRKRRKNWRVQRVEINRPGALMVSGIMYVHPDLLGRLKTVATVGLEGG